MESFQDVRYTLTRPQLRLNCIVLSNDCVKCPMKRYIYNWETISFKTLIVMEVFSIIQFNSFICFSIIINNTIPVTKIQLTTMLMKTIIRKNKVWINNWSGHLVVENVIDYFVCKILKFLTIVHRIVSRRFQLKYYRLSVHKKAARALHERKQNTLWKLFILNISTTTNRKIENFYFSQNLFTDIDTDSMCF